MSVWVIERRWVTIQAGTFYYLGAGAPDAPLVLCLHGFPDHPPTFEPLLRRLVKAGYRVAAPWLRGYRPSPSLGPYAVDRLARDIVDIADALSPERPVHLVGHDWGAMITYEAIATSPHRFASAIAMSVPYELSMFGSLARDPSQRRRSWYIFFFLLPRIPEWVVRRRDFSFIDDLWRRWSPGFALPADQRRALHACLDASIPAPLEYYRAVFRPLSRMLARARREWKQRIVVPTLYIHGDQDGCIDVSAARGQERWFAGPFSQRIVSGAGHFMHLEVPDAIAEHIVAFCQRHAVSP